MVIQNVLILLILNIEYESHKKNEFYMKARNL